MLANALEQRVTKQPVLLSHPQRAAHVLRLTFRRADDSAAFILYVAWIPASQELQYTARDTRTLRTTVARYDLAGGRK